MSYLINNNLIWIMTPKCASHSIEKALINSNLKLKKFDEYFYSERHLHIPLNDSIDYFGNKETICVTRNWFDKFLSALSYMWDLIELHTPYTPICKWEDLDNEKIYKIFDTQYINNLYQISEDNTKKCFLKLIKDENKEKLEIPIEIFTSVVSLISEKYYKSNKKCSYEFDIKELNKFVDFFWDKYNIKLDIKNENKSTKRLSKIVINDELKTFVWEQFEKRFEKTNQLI